MPSKVTKAVDNLQKLKNLRQTWQQAEAEATRLNTEEASVKAAKALRAYLAAHNTWSV